jgi:hypothetical protein
VKKMESGSNFQMPSKANEDNPEYDGNRVFCANRNSELK